MNAKKWTLGLAALGLVSTPLSQAEEKMNQLWTALSSTTLSGYVNTSIHWNTGTGNERVPMYVYNDSSKQDGFNLNVVDLTLEKAMDEAQWAAGYKVQLWFGPDATTFGTTLDSNADSSPMAIKQAYVGLRTPVGNGLDFKIGVFDGLLGYESHDAGRNPNYTRAYGMALTPHTHTGLQMAYQFSPLVSASAAIANTVGPVINAKAHLGTTPRAESYKSYTGAMALTAPEDWGFVSGSTLYGGVLNGYSENDDWNQTSWYTGITLNTPVKAVKVGSSYVYMGTTSSGAGANNYANALAGYVSFQATEKLSLHGRGEYVWTDANLFGTVPIGGNTGGNNEIFGLTGTVQYDLWKNVISRLEIRWDHLAGDGDMVGYGSGTDNKRNGVLIAANVIYQF
jgi:hypothetical protein